MTRKRKMNMESVKKAIRKGKSFKNARPATHMDKQQLVVLKNRNKEVAKC